MHSSGSGAAERSMESQRHSAFSQDFQRSFVRPLGLYPPSVGPGAIHVRMTSDPSQGSNKDTINSSVWLVKAKSLGEERED